MHCIRQLYEDNDIEALLFVDATNAFNSLNREVALRNSLHLCPSLGRVLTNIYREGACLYIDGEVIRSAKGTTQGDPMAMAMYAVGISPLIQRLTTINDTRQIWYADDCTGCGSLQDLSQWWLSLSEMGSQYGYSPNASKSILLVKEEHQERAQHLFQNCNISIVTEGACVLGSPIGTSEYVNNWMDNKVQSWVDEITTLSTIVRTQPQSAFSALTHGIMSHWTYILRTCPDISTHLIPLENTLRTVFIPALTSQGPPNDLVRDLFSLPFRLGGLGIPNPSLLSNDQYANSLSVTAPLINLLVNQCDSIPSDVFSAQLNAKQIIRNSRSRALRERSITIHSDLPPPLQRLFDIANEKGSST